MFGFRNTRWSMLGRRWLIPAICVALFVGVFRSAAADWNYVFSNSMNPSIQVGDCVLVNKLAYELNLPLTNWRSRPWASPDRGDVVVINAPDDGERLVKRIVGVPGDFIELRDNVLVVNGEPVTNGAAGAGGDYRLSSEKLGDRLHAVAFCVDRPARRSFGPIRVRDGQYFVLGDNRDESVDSRSFGLVALDQIVGRVVAVTFAFNPQNHFAPAWGRSFRRVP
jgi:signal peptidase I